MSRKYAKYIMYGNFLLSMECSAQELFNACISACTLPFSRPFLTMTDGHEFTFHQIGADQFDKAGSDVQVVQTHFDETGQLIAFHDGRIKPLVLGSMPRKSEYIAQLRQSFNIGAEAPIEIYSLNRPFELGWKGVPDAIGQAQHVDLLLHPTTDECAPSLVDTLRAVKKLRKRDESAHALSYVQCLAGHGRSATLVSAYMYSALQGHCELPDPDVIERYLKTKRPFVSLSPLQKQFLAEFREQLQSTSFEQLCLDHAQEMQARDEELTYEHMAPIIRQSGTDYGLLVCGAAMTTSVAAGMGLYKLIKAHRK